MAANCIKGLQDLGFFKVKPCTRGVCGMCEQTLRVCATRINPIEVVDLYCCDHCGRIWIEGARGLLVEVGRRANETLQKMQQTRTVPD